MQINCSKYSDLDDKVIEKMTEYGLPLIGGTALEIWAAHFNTIPPRKRSDNDLDCISNHKGTIALFSDWLKSIIDPNKVKVDCMYIKSHDISNYITTVDGILIMTLPYILWSKLKRHASRDLTDIAWILKRPEVTDDEIVDALEDLGVTNEEIVILNNIS